MANFPGSIQCEAEDHFRDAQQVQQEMVSTSRSQISIDSWNKLLDFCLWITLAPDFDGVINLVP